MQHLPQVEAARSGDGYDYTSCFKHVAPLFRQADLAVINLETTLKSSPPYSGYPAFGSPVQLAHAVRGMGVDVALLANNHICDRAAIGIRETTAALDADSLLYVGAWADSSAYCSGNPLIVSRGGLRMALYNYTYGTNGLSTPRGMVVNRIDTTRIAHDRACADSVDVSILCLHWGNEYQRTPSAAQREVAEWALNHGFELIIGSHPHVIQPFESSVDSLGRVTSLSVYSLGNFVSNQRFEHTDGGLMVRIKVVEEGGRLRFEPEYLPVWRYRRTVGGRSEYAVIPAFAADSLLATDAAAKTQFDRFAVSTARLLAADTTFVEIVGY